MDVEAKRLEALRSARILDTMPEARFDRLTSLAAALFDTPIALLSLVDDHRQWFKSRHGLAVQQTPRAQSFCAHALSLGANATLVIPDAACDMRFSTNLLVTGDPHIRFYAGAALTTREGHNLGTLCVIDTKPRKRPDEAMLAQLQSLARVVVDELEFTAAASALEDKARLLKLAEAMSGVGHWRYDTAAETLTWSDEVYRIHGLDRREFDPNYGSAVGFYHPDDQTVVDGLIQRAVADGVGFEFQLRLLRKDGELRHVVARAECETEPLGNTTAVVGVFQDITDQVRTIEAAKRNEAHYRLLANNVGDVITRIRLDGASDYISPSIEQLLGFTPSEMAGKPAQAFVHPDDQPMIMAVFAELAQGLQQKTVRHRAVRKSGDPVWVETNFRLVRDLRGKPTEMVAVIRDVTDRKALELAAEEARDEAEEKASQAVAAERIAGLGHWRITFPDNAVSWSEQMYVIYGLEAHTPLDVARIMAMTHPEDRSVTQDRLNRDLRGDTSESRPEIRIVRPSGETRFVVGDTRVERDAAGQVRALIGTLTDVTEQRESERILAESEERYRLLAENVTDMIVTTNFSGQVIYASPSCETVMGYSAEELKNTRAMARTHPDDVAVVQRVFSALAAGAAPERFRWRAKHKASGEWVWLESKPGLLRDSATGKPTGFLDVIRDATEQHSVETEVALSEARYRLLAEKATDMIVTSTLEGRTVYVSPAALKLTGYSVEEAMGIRTLDLVHPDDGPVMIKAFRALVKGSAPERVRWRGMHKNGDWTWFESMPALVRDSVSAEAAGFVDVVRDVTVQVAQEKELEAARAEAEAATAVKTEFLANMSHELRTPLTSILGFSELLRGHTNGGAEAGRYLDRVAGASEALLSIVNDILDFSKLEAGQVEIDPRAVAPARLFEDAVELLSPQAGAKGLSLNLDISGALPEAAMLDDTRIRQVILNLTSNAVKFTAEGGVTVRLSHTNASLRCDIIDTGPGIPADRLNRLFQRFSQVDASTTRSHGGTGLGLAICKGLVEAMGGRIGAESREGEGSVFWFELPCEQIEPGELDAVGADVFEGSHALGGLRVLAVDDNPMNRELIRLILTPAEIEVTVVASGEEAITAAAEAPFDIILMDIRMPGLGGPETARHIRETRGPNDLTPILAFTADADTGSMPAQWGRFFEDRVNKPIIPADLFNALARWAPGGAGAEILEAACV